MTVPLPPPVSSFGTFFFLRSAPASMAQNAAITGKLSEPRVAADRPISGRLPSLSAEFLWRNRTTAILIRMLDIREINRLEEVQSGVGLTVARSGGVSWDRMVRFGSDPGR